MQDTSPKTVTSRRGHDVRRGGNRRRWREGQHGVHQRSDGASFISNALPSQHLDFHTQST